MRLMSKPIVSSCPMLAMPLCDENARLPKLAIVVRAQATTARDVLVANGSPPVGGSVRMR
ncbi:hypothetical protein D3C83_293420 [compost metagenome]